MAPNVSVSKQVSKSPSDNISFKNKRRRKSSSSINFSSITRVQEDNCHLLQVNKSNKSPKHRWKLNVPTADRSMTQSLRKPSECFQQRPHNNPLHDMRNVDDKCQRSADSRVDNYQNSINVKTSQHGKSLREKASFHDVSSTSDRKPQRCGLSYCRKLLEWTTSSSARKLLPIFILVNMLPFLYAGESRTIQTPMIESSQ